MQNLQKAGPGIYMLAPYGLCYSQYQEAVFGNVCNGTVRVLFAEFFRHPIYVLSDLISRVIILQII